MTDDRKLAATTLAQYVRLESCERYLWYRLHPKETRELFREYRVTEQPLTPLLSEKGARHEERSPRSFAPSGLRARRSSRSRASRRRSPSSGAARRRRGCFSRHASRERSARSRRPGIADLVIVEPGETAVARHGRRREGEPARPAEHRIQVAFYARLIRQLAARAGVEIEEMTRLHLARAAGARRRAAGPVRPPRVRGGGRAAGRRREPLSRRSQPARARTRASTSRYKCDGCLYNALCMREAAEAEALALVPFMSMRDRARARASTASRPFASSPS